MFSKYAKDGNHRNFITHSIYIPVLIELLALILFLTHPLILSNYFHSYYFLIVGGIAYLIHILMDLIDWGVPLFYFGKTFGLFLLLSQDEKNLNFNNYENYIKNKMKQEEFFFAKRYYNNFLIQIIELFIGVIGFAILFIFTPHFWYAYLGYFILLEIHLNEKKKADESKKIENN